MHTIKDVKGPTLIRRDSRLNGVAYGDVTVAPGILLELNGRVCGNLMACKGSRAVINGVVMGRVFDEGASVEIFGLVGTVRDSDARDAYRHPGAILRPSPRG